ncbi:hypothetical protein QF021_002252 [Acidovorax delafieldii]|nr:hypothetical protein [Acidovorax delafieldii]
MRAVAMHTGPVRMGHRVRGTCMVALLGVVVALAGCSSSQGERILMKGCKEGGVSDKDCQCATQEVGKRYDLKNLQEFMNDRAIPMQTLQMDFVKALAMCTARPGSEVR